MGQQIVRENSYAFAAVCPHDGTLHSLVLPEVNSVAMSIFLAELARHHHDQYLRIVLDGAGWHRWRELVLPENMRLLPLPPDRPQLNPVEHLWDDTCEKFFANVVFDSHDGVDERLVEALASLHADPARTQSLTGFDWIVSISMNAN